MENEKTGGDSAFPCDGIELLVERDLKEEIGEAYGVFLRTLPRRYVGLTKREYFAAKAMNGLSVGCAGLIGDDFSAYAKGHCNSALAERSVALADALITALEGKEPGAEAEKIEERIELSDYYDSDGPDMNEEGDK